MLLRGLDIQTLLVHVIILFTAFPVHEFAHAWAANKLGDRTAEYQGRLTLNPIAHLDLFGSLSMLLLGFGWAKPVPVNPNNFRNVSYKTGMAITSLAGPLSNIIMAYISLIVLKVLFYMGVISAFGHIETIISYMILVNLVLAVFNLLPIPPLDGSKILAIILPDRHYYRLMQYERYFFIVLIALMFTGVLSIPLNALLNLMYFGLDFLTKYVDIIMRGIMS